MLSGSGGIPAGFEDEYASDDVGVGDATTNLSYNNNTYGGCANNASETVNRSSTGFKSGTSYGNARSARYCVFVCHQCYSFLLSTMF